MDILEVNKPLYRNVDGKKVKINPLTKAECIIMSDGLSKNRRRWFHRTQAIPCHCCL